MKKHGLDILRTLILHYSVDLSFLNNEKEEDFCKSGRFVSKPSFTKSYSYINTIVYIFQFSEWKMYNWRLILVDSPKTWLPFQYSSRWGTDVQLETKPQVTWKKKSQQHTIIQIRSYHDCYDSSLVYKALLL